MQLPASWTTGFEYWVAAAGGKLISEDGKQFAGYMDSPDVQEAVQFYADLYNKYKVAPPPADMNSWGGGNSEFDNGTAAMRLFGRWPQAGMKKNPNIDLGVVGVPAGKQRANVLFWGGFGIFSAAARTRRRPGASCATTRARKAPRSGKTGRCPPSSRWPIPPACPRTPSKACGSTS